MNESKAHNAKAAPGLINKINPGEHITADKGNDAEVICGHILQAGAVPIIARKSNCHNAKPEFDSRLLRQSHLVKILFARLHFRRNAIPIEKRERSVRAVLFYRMYFYLGQIEMGITKNASQNIFWLASQAIKKSDATTGAI